MLIVTEQLLKVIQTGRQKLLLILKQQQCAIAVVNIESPGGTCCMGDR
jgi:hypothetical protein